MRCPHGIMKPDETCGVWLSCTLGNSMEQNDARTLSD
jgi:hypothetical protein